MFLNVITYSVVNHRSYVIVRSQEADIALTGLTISAAREEAVDFTDPFFYEPTAIAVTAPSIVSKSI